MEFLHKITILVPRGYYKNDHLKLFYRLLNKQSFHITEFSFLKLIKPEQNKIWHIHWINQYISGTVTSLGINKPIFFISYLRAIYFLTLLHFAIMYGVKIIWTVHNVESHFVVDTRVENYITRKILAVANRVIALNEYIKKELTNKYQFNDAIILRRGGYSGSFPALPDKLIARKRLGVSKDDFVLLFFGNIMHYKGVVLLVEAFQSS